MATKKEIHDKAIEYAKNYGILRYRVNGRFLIYNQTYGSKIGEDGEIERPCTYQSRVNLLTGEVERVKLKVVKLDGRYNV